MIKKPGKYLFVLLISLLASVATCNAQAVADSTHVDSSAADGIILPPLDTLYAWAVRNSPVLKGQDALIEKTSQDTKRVKKILLDALKLNANIQGGNYGDPIVNKISTGYNTGASLQFSLYQLFGYKNQVNVYNAEKKVAMYKRDELEMSLRKMIMLLYNNIQAQNNILKIRSDGSYSAYSHVKMAEKQFAVGAIEVGELSRVTEIYTKAQVDYELAVNDLKNYYMDLEQLVGVNLSTYKN